MEPGQDVGADEELVEIEEGAQASSVVRELARIAQRAGFIKRGRPNWGALAAHSGLSPATLRAVVTRAERSPRSRSGVADCAQGCAPDDSRVRLASAAGWLRYEDVVAHAHGQGQTTEENLAAARRIIRGARRPEIVSRVRLIAAHRRPLPCVV